MRLVDARPQMTIWRQGYCQPYGEDVTYSALAQIVKGHAGILDNDELDTVEAKLDAVLPGGPDREWLRERLRRPAGPRGTRGVTRGELHRLAALLRGDGSQRSRPCSCSRTCTGPTTPCSPSWEHLATHVASVPLAPHRHGPSGALRGPAGLRHGRRAYRASVWSRCPPPRRRALVSGLLGATDEQAAAVEGVVERCDGNPFFAEQSVRLLAESVTGKVPSSVQAVIAARLDSLPIKEKSPARRRRRGGQRLLGRRHESRGRTPARRA